MPRRRTEFGNSLYEECGTYKGVNKHARYKTMICKPCNTARNQWMKDHRHRTGISSGTWVYVPDEIELTDDHYSI
jgi:hypothetical protein